MIIIIIIKIRYCQRRVADAEVIGAESHDDDAVYIEIGNNAYTGVVVAPCSGDVLWTCGMSSYW